MNRLSSEELKELLEQRSEHSLSIYIPTHRYGKEVRQDPIRFRNLLREAETRLEDAELNRAQIADLLKPAEALLKSDDFWQYSSDGLAVFVSHSFFEFFRLPVPFKELLVVTDRFHSKPLLQLFSSDGRFYVLAVSQNEIRLLYGTRYGVSEVEERGLPEDLADALKYDDPERQLQFHTRAARGDGRRAAVFHGHGVGVDDSKDRLLRYFREIDSALTETLKGERAPLILAAVDYFYPIYREVNSYPNLIEVVIPGNPELLSAEELHARAWELLQPHFRQEQERAATRYHEAVSAGLVSNSLDSVLRMAHQGRIDSLFVAVGVQKWGRFDPETLGIEMRDEPDVGDEDLLDLAAVATVLNGGDVFAVQPSDVPGGGEVAALYRY